MQSKRAAIMFVCAATCYGLPAAPVYADMSLDDIANLSVDTAPAAAAISTARANMLSEAALLLGSHKGLADRSVQLIAELEARASRPGHALPVRRTVLTKVACCRPLSRKRATPFRPQVTRCAWPLACTTWLFLLVS